MTDEQRHQRDLMILAVLGPKMLDALDNYELECEALSSSQQ